ncbi:hypothetical protein GCM10007385_30880 [Tateyamaria omphalii]|uniref:hypothetical protein n=1 Tax=Tateyamaria omphalii TaxID=299262 RepID=UPI0016796D04|nr:hypothetical protein [Tateyamaria omphalii]GGX59514.1 hypothetical protein GCM10007385_30880 [Tateyamaria omphalii]
MRLATACLMLLAIAACGDPLRGIERVSEGATLPAEPGNSALPSAEELAREGPVLADLLNDANAEVPADDAQIDPAPLGAEAPDIAAIIPPQADTAPVEQSQQAPRASGGLLGWLRIARQADTPLNANAVQASATPQNVEAALPAKAEDIPAAQIPALVEPEKRRGLFGRPRRSTARDASVIDVGPGMTVPFGQIARVCNAHPAKTAQMVDKAARKGRGYTLYDTAPDSTAPRTFYVTGFSDNCPRQFTAALALFGDPAFHEQLRYGLPAEEYPYSTTDKAYEQLKRRVCNVGRNKPCGDRISRLSRNTTFISAYENFTDNGRWADMLLHDGAVLATALKTP